MKLEILLLVVLILAGQPSFSIGISAMPTTLSENSTEIIATSPTRSSKSKTKKAGDGDSKLKKAADKLIDQLADLGIPSEKKGSDFLSVVSLICFGAGLLISLIFAPLGFIFFLAAALLAVLALFNISKNKELKGKGYVYAAAILAGFTLVATLVSLFVLFLVLLATLL